MYIPERDEEFFHEEVEKENEYYENEYGENADLMDQVNKKMKPKPPPKPSYLTSPEQQSVEQQSSEHNLSEDQKEIENQMEEEEDENLHQIPQASDNIPVFGTVQIPSIGFCILTGIILPVLVFPILCFLIWIFHSYLFERISIQSIPIFLSSTESSTQYIIQFAPTIQNKTLVYSNSFVQSFQPFFSKFINYQLIITPSKLSTIQVNISGIMDIFSADSNDWKWQSKQQVFQTIGLDSTPIYVPILQIDSLSETVLIQASNFSLQSSSSLDNLPILSFQFQTFFFGFSGAQLGISLVAFIFSFQLLLLYWKWYHHASKSSEQKLLLVILCLLCLYNIPIYNLCYLFNWKWLEWISLATKWFWLHCILLAWYYLLLIPEKTKASISWLVISVSICIAASFCWIALSLLQIIDSVELQLFPILVLIVLYIILIIVGLGITITNVLMYNSTTNEQQYQVKQHFAWMNFGLQTSLSLAIAVWLIVFAVLNTNVWTEFHAFFSFALPLYCIIVCWLWRPSQTKILLDRSLLSSR